MKGVVMKKLAVVLAIEIVVMTGVGLWLVAGSGHGAGPDALSKIPYAFFGR